MSILLFLDKGRQYVEGFPFLLLFDHKNMGEKELATIWTNRIKADKISRWAERIQSELRNLFFL